MIRVLLLGGGLQALSIGESLVFFTNCYELAIVSDDFQILRSRFFKYKYSPQIIVSEDSLCNFVFCNSFDVIIPMADIYTSLLSKCKKCIEDNCRTRCATPDYEVLSLVSNKKLLMNFCSKNGIPHPRTSPLSDERLDEVVRSIGFPALIKPDHSVGARGIKKVYSIDDLKTFYPIILKKYGSCTLQEYIDNLDYYYNVMLYRKKEGSYLGNTIIKITRMYPVEGGSSCFCTAVENDDLLEICKLCLDKLNWVGMADFDVLQRKDTKEYKIIEINPRVPASLRAAFISGVNFPEIIVNDTLGNEVHNYNYVPGNKLRYLGLDFLWFLKSHNRFSNIFIWLNFLGRDVYYQDIFRCDSSSWYSWLIEGIIKLKRR